MQRHEVASRSLASVGYDAGSRTLEVEFQSGAVYQYAGVPHAVAQSLVRARSIGAYFSRFVRDGYEYMRVE